METKNLLAVLAIFALVLAVLNISVTLIKVSDFRERITGFATGAGEVNLTVETEVSVNMSNDITSWGSGVVDGGQFNASLVTSTTESAGVCTRGNWSGTNAKGLFLENRGNNNVSIKVYTDRDAHGLFGSLTSTNEAFYLNVTNNGSSGCSNATTLNTTVALNTYNDINTSSPGDVYCSALDYHDGINSVYIDTWLDVPYDATNISTELATMITVTASAV